MPGQDISARVTMGRGIAVGRQADEAVTELLQKEEYEPLAHELAREALALYSTSPRTALITAVVALETGVKNYIKDVAPNTSWLVENVASPPVERLMNEYIPKLNSNEARPEFRLTPGELALLKKRISQRNGIVHGAALSPDVGTVKEFVGFVINVLYKLDFCRGLAWAQALAERDTA
jgi:hypothetical protein